MGFPGGFERLIALYQVYQAVLGDLLKALPKFLVYYAINADVTL